MVSVNPICSLCHPREGKIAQYGWFLTRSDPNGVGFGRDIFELGRVWVLQ